MEYRIIETFADFESLKEDWERIEKLSCVTTYTSTFHYNFLWWENYSDTNSGTLFIIVIYNNGKATGIAPLKIERAKSRLYSYNELVFLAPGDYSDFLIDTESEVDPMKIVSFIFTVIEKNKEKYDRIWLTHFSQHTILTHYLFISSYNKNLHYLIENPYIDFTRFSSFEEYTNLFLPKKIKQYINRFQREVKYKMVVTSENIIEKISKVHIAEKAHLNAKGKTERHSSFEDPKTYSFINSLYTNNPNVLTYMLVDDDNEAEIICFYTGYVYNDVFHSGITAYSPKYQRLSVGKIFNYMIFEHNHAEPSWKIFDMGTGRYSWKFEMTDSFNLLYQVNIFQPSRKSLYYLNKCEKLILAILQFLRK